MANSETDIAMGVDKTETQEVNNKQKRPAEEEAQEDNTAKKMKVVEDPNDLERKIINQIEYYFGDLNLSRDKFMQQKMTEDNGWIPLTVLTTFKRLANLTTDHDVIINALRKSEKQLVAINDDKTKVRRAPEYPIPELNEERKKELMKRSAYVKGFPVNIDLESLLKWFEDKENIEGVHKRTYLDKAAKEHRFKGSVFVVFKTVEDCKKFIEGGPYHYDTDKAELIVKWQEVYLTEKKTEYQEVKERQEKARKETKDNIKAKLESKDSFKELNNCSVLHISDLKPETVREDIKSYLIETYDIEPRYVDFRKDDTEAFVRLQNVEEGTKLMEKIGDNQMKINGAEVKTRLLEGEELQKFIEKVKISIINKKDQIDSKKHNKRGRKNKKNKTR